MTRPRTSAPWLRQQREQRSWTRTEMARRLSRVAQASGDTAMPVAQDVAASIYRWERSTVNPGDRYGLYYCHTLGIQVRRSAGGDPDIGGGSRPGPPDGRPGPRDCPVGGSEDGPLG